MTVETECPHGIDEATCDYCTGKVRAERAAASVEPDSSYNRSQCVDRMVDGKVRHGCGATIAWVVLPSGKRNPVDLTPSGEGTVLLTGGGAGRIMGKREVEESTARRYVTHFASCPHANEHRA